MTGPTAISAGGTEATGSTGTPIRLVVVDDHVIVREGLHAVLELEPDLRVVGEAGTRVAALRIIELRRPDIVLLDLKLGHASSDDGLALCEQIGRRFAGVQVIVLTTFEDRELLVGSLRRGAKGYVLKDVDADELVRIIRAVARGESGFDTRSASLVVQSVAAPDLLGPRLTQREVEILRLVADGLTNRQIGQRIYLSQSAVKLHLRKTMAKLGVHRRAEAAYAAARLHMF